MATASGPVVVLQASKGKNRFVRLARLLGCGGTRVMRELFDYKFPPANLVAKLSHPSVEARLKQMKSDKILKYPQWQKLYPSSGAGPVQSTSFDITLLFTLLRENVISGLLPPSTGWDKLPILADKSLPADMARIKYYRNFIAHGDETMELSEQEFSDYWTEIKEALVRIVGHYAASGSSTVRDWETAIESLQNDTLTEADEAWYLTELRQLVSVISKNKEFIVRCVVRIAGVGAWLGGTICVLDSLKDNPDALIDYVKYSIIPTGLAFVGFAFGSIKITMRVDTLDALDEILKRYNTGQLKDDFEKVLITEELKNLANGQRIELTVQLDEEKLMAIRKLLVVEELPIQDKERALPCFPAASATYLDLGLTNKESDSELLRFSKPGQTMSGSRECREEETDSEVHEDAGSLFHNMKLMLDSFGHNEEYDDAILYSKKCLSTVQESGDKEVEMGVYKLLGDAHLKKEEYDDAILYSEKYLATAQVSGNKAAEMQAYILLGEAHLKKEEYDYVRIFYKKCLDIAQESGDKEAETKAYMRLGIAYLKKEEYDDAIIYLKKDLAIAQESGDKEAETKACMRLGTAYLKKKVYGDAILYSKKCLLIAQESGDKAAEMQVYMLLGEAHLKKEEYDDAISYSKKCLTIAQKSGNKWFEMGVYKLLGEVHLAKQEYDDAISYREKCLTIAQESGNQWFEMGMYKLLGEVHLAKQEYDDAILYSKRCLIIAQESGDKVAEMNAYKLLGDAHLKKEEYDDAILYSEKYLATAQVSGDKKAEMGVYKLLGKAHLKKEEYEDAISYSKKFLLIAQVSRDKEAEKDAYIILGKAHLAKKEYNNAISQCKKFLLIAQESLDKEAEMDAYIMLGKVHLAKKEYDDAISYSKKCLLIAQESRDEKTEMGMLKLFWDARLKEIERYLAIAQESGDKATEMQKEYDDAISYCKKFLLIGQESREAEMDAYIILGKAELAKEEYDGAISYSRKCLAIAQDSGDKAAEMQAYMLLGDAHLKKEEYANTISYYQKCLAIAQAGGKEEMELYLALGVVYWKTSKYDDAYSCLTKGKKIATDLQDDKLIFVFDSYFSMIYEEVGIYMPNDVESVQNTLVQAAGSGNIFQHDTFRWVASYVLYKRRRGERDYDQAISHLKDAESTVATTQHGDGSIELWLCKNGISEMHVLNERYNESIQYQKEALKVAPTKAQKAKSHFSLGEIYYKLGQLDNAKKSLEESLKYYELIFDDLKQNDRFKIAFDEKYKTAYKMFLKVLIETNKKEEALVLSDRYRAKALKDLLVSSYGVNEEPIARDVLQLADIQSLVSSRNYSLLLYSTCFEKLGTFLIEAGNELEFSVQYFKYCDKCLDDLVNQAFADMKVRQVVNCAGRALVVMEENRKPKEDELTRSLILQIEKSLSEQCRYICECRGSPTDNSDESSLTSGLEILYHKLIENIKCLVKQDEIVIIPEGPLCKVPFAALRNPDTGQYLSETKRIRMAPSMATLKLLQNYPEEHHSSKDALIIGSPLVGRVMLNEVETEISPLPGALDEAINIARILGVQPLLAANATKPAVIKRLQEGASVVHVAAHGFLSKATIVLAPSPEIRATKIPEEEDYMLTMADVQQAQVRAQLVVLSCCYSGRGQIKAEGVVGMCRAFLASGARAVMGSHWAVDDEATWMFMETFYKYLKDGKSASKSLHLTMNDMRRTPEYSEPKYWAPFFLMGDDVTIKFED